MGDINRLCFPTFLHDRQVPGQDHLGKSLLDPRNSPLEITSLVPSHLVNVGGDTATILPSHKKILTDPLENSHPMVLQGHL